MGHATGRLTIFLVFNWNEGFTFSPVYMIRTTAIFFLFFIALSGYAQVVFKTIAPGHPVSAGESFRIQYYVEGAASHELIPPDFTPFQLVEGPDIYPGKSKGAGLLSKNYVYTLIAAQPGEYTLPGATLRTGGSTMKSSEARIRVVKEVAATPGYGNDQPTGYYLQPGENVQEKIRQNLFLKVVADKQSCYVGEPVQVTFRLYSRLESRSDIIKNPGFYGFTVHDMISLADQQLGTEKINGKEFDVHIIRKVQLYPLQAGQFTIDPMEVKNKVEFSSIVQNRKTQQRIAEGMQSGAEDEPARTGTSIVENEMRTTALVINVKPLPEKNKPADFNSAVGHFKLSTQLEKKQLARNEEGVLVVTIEGRGNFVQLSAPLINWPSGMEGFSATVTDSLDKAQVPLAGKRQFRYGFVCNNPGAYQLPAVRFSFFDTDSNRYRTQETGPLVLTVNPEEKKETVTEEHNVSIDVLSRQKSKIAIIVVFLLVAGVLAFWALKKKPEEPEAVPVKPEKPHIDEWLARASGLAAVDPDFYAELHRAVWTYFDQCFGIEGTARNKENLFGLLRMKGAGGEDVAVLANILSACETGMYTRAGTGENDEQLLELSRQLLGKMNELLF